MLAALIIAGLLPLLWPSLPPLADLPGHMGRWHIQMAHGEGGPLAQYYDFAWAPIGNLGMDLLVPAIAKVLPFELAAKYGTALIPLLTMTGMLWIAREAHGRVPPTALFALPLAYAWPFQFGFVNFALSQALALCAFALWIRLGRSQRYILRALTFAPIACLIWLAHSFGWMMLCLMIGGTEMAQLLSNNGNWRTKFIDAAARCWPMTLPFLAMAWLSRGQGLGGGDWFNWSAKLLWLISILRDRWAAFDILCLIPIIFILYFAARMPKLGFSPIIGWPALLLFCAFVLLPRLAFGGAYVDMRMAPAVVMLALLAIAPPTSSARLAQTLAVAGLVFFCVRTVGTTVSFGLRSIEQQRELAAISTIPRGASVLSLVSRPCGGAWSDLRRDQLGGMAIVRRDVFTNSQWSLAGQQLLSIRNVAATPYLSDPSQLVYPSSCPDIGSNFRKAIREFPRRGFTHIWTIGFPPARLAPDLKLIWTNGGSALYRVRR